MSFDIIVIGDVVSELCLDAHSSGGSEDSYIVSTLQERIGGDALDIGMVCASGGLSCSLVSAIGIDASSVLDCLDRSKIDYSHLIVCDSKTGKKIKVIVDSASTDLTYEGASSHIFDYGIDKDFFSDSRLIHLTTFSPERYDAIQMEKRPHCTCQYSPGTDIGEYPEDIGVLFMESSDAMALSGEDECCEAVEALVPICTCPTVVADRGRGAYVISDKSARSISMVPAVSYDASRFYSSFVGAFLSRYVKTNNLRSSASYGLSYQYFSYTDSCRVVGRDSLEIESVMRRIARMNV